MKDVYNLSKYGWEQIIDTTIIKFPNQGGYLLRQRIIKCIEQNIHEKTQNQENQTIQRQKLGAASVYSFG